MTGLFDNIETPKVSKTTRQKKEDKPIEVKEELNKTTTLKEDCIKPVKLPDNIYRIKDYFKDEIISVIDKEKNKENLKVIINTLFLKTVDKVASEFGKKYV